MSLLIGYLLGGLDDDPAGGGGSGSGGNDKNERGVEGGAQKVEEEKDELEQLLKEAGVGIPDDNV